MTRSLPRKFVFVGVTGARNRGVEALVHTASAGLTALNPEAEILIVSSDAAYDRRILGENAEVIADCPAFFRASRRRRKLRMALGIRLPWEVRAYQKALADADVVIASGGDIFSADYGVPFLRRQVALVEEAQRAGKKTVFLGHSIGPFKTGEERAVMIPVLQASSLITVRENFSRRYLIETLGIAEDRVVLTADVAFVMEPTPAERVDVLRRMTGLASGRPYLAFAPSEGITSFASSHDIDNHDQAWVRLIQHALATTDRDILLVPHVQDSNIKNDDNRIIFRLLEALDAPSRVHAAFGCHSAMDFKGLIGGADMLVGERMHACIAGLSQNVPTLAIGYSVKAAGIMDDLLGTEAGRRKLVIPVQDFVRGDDFLEAFDRTWVDREAIGATLAQATPGAKALARRNFDLVMAL